MVTVRHDNTRKTRGNALLMIMIMMVGLLSLILYLISISQQAAAESDREVEYTRSLELAEHGLNRVLMEMEDLRSVGGEWRDWVEMESTDPEITNDGLVDARTKVYDINGGFVAVRARSAFLNHRDGDGTFMVDVQNSRGSSRDSLFGLYQISVAAEVIGPENPVRGIAHAHNYQRGLTAMVELRKETLLQQLDSALYLQGDGTVNGYEFIVSGEDHSVTDTLENASLIMPFDADVTFSFRSSSAGIDSALMFVDPNDPSGAEKTVFKSNHINSNHPDSYKKGELDNGQIPDFVGTFGKNQALNFFAFCRAHAWNSKLPDYKHYTEGYDSVTGWTWARKVPLTAEGKAHLTDGRTAYITPKDGDKKVYEANPDGSIKSPKREVTPVVIDWNKKDPNDPNKYEYEKFMFNNDEGKRVIRLQYGIEDLPGDWPPDWDRDDIVWVCDVVETDDGKEDQPRGQNWWNQNEGDTLNGNESVNAVTQPVTDPGVITTTDQRQNWQFRTGNQVYFMEWVPDTSRPDGGYFVGPDDKEYSFPSGTTAAQKQAAIDQGGAFVDLNHSVPGQKPTVARIVELQTSDPHADNYVTPDQYQQARDNGGYFEGFDIPENATKAERETALEARETEPGDYAKSESDTDIDKVIADILSSPGTQVNTITSIKDGTGFADLGEWHGADSDANDYKVTVLNGNLDGLNGKTLAGHGVLIVNGDVTIDGTFAFAGVLIVKGNVTVAEGVEGQPNIVPRIVTAGSALIGGNMNLRNDSKLWYSSELIETVVNTSRPKPRITVLRQAWSSHPQADVAALLTDSSSLRN